MKKLLPFGLLLVAISSWGWAGHQNTGDLESRVSGLETELAELQRSEAELRKQVEKTVEYLDSQAKAAKAMMSVLDQSEAEGFTAGINYASRETLLAGWRVELTSKQEDLPSAKPEKKDDVVRRR